MALRSLLNASLSLGEDDTRKICKGEYLIKSNLEDDMVWHIKNRRPQDILTLIRKFLLYRLTQRGKLFVRSFLAKN